MGWPKLEDGSVDWNQVFSAPGTGFIPMVLEADTAEKLKSCVQVIISSLFSRENDQKYAQAYIITLNEVFDAIFASEAEDALSKAQSKAIILLKSIQENRQERARQYAEFMADGDDRRLSIDDPLALLSVLDDGGAEQP